MAFNHAIGQRLAIYSKTMVHGGDFNLASVMVFDRVVRPMMAMAHLDGLGTNCERKHLVTKANPKDRKVSLVKNTLDHRNCIFASCSRIARTIGEENTVRFMCKHLFSASGCGKDHNVTTR